MATRTFADISALAQSKGGRCLSAPADYVDTKSALRFVCGHGHEWSTRVTNLLHRGRWCPVCGAANSPPLTLDDVKAMAAARGGDCLNESYLGIHRKHLFRCGLGHVWEAQPANLRHRGSWCPACADRPQPLTSEASALKLAQIREIARNRLGRCLSNVYLGDKVHLLFECADGHQWWTTPNTIKRPHWCPLCKHGKPRNEVVTGMATQLPPANALSQRTAVIERVFKALADRTKEGIND